MNTIDYSCNLPSFPSLQVLGLGSLDGMDSNGRPRFDKWNEIWFGPSRIDGCMKFWSYVIFEILGLTFHNQFKIKQNYHHR
jgi:hypothetical protein